MILAGGSFQGTWNLEVLLLWICTFQLISNASHRICSTSLSVVGPDLLIVESLRISRSLLVDEEHYSSFANSTNSTPCNDPASVC